MRDVDFGLQSPPSRPPVDHRLDLPTVQLPYLWVAHIDTSIQTSHGKISGISGNVCEEWFELALLCLAPF
jgi:hypothetical protein